jgi:hypothetical protein
METHLNGSKVEKRVKKHKLYFGPWQNKEKETKKTQPLIISRPTTDGKVAQAQSRGPTQAHEEGPQPGRSGPSQVERKGQN